MIKYLFIIFILIPLNGISQREVVDTTNFDYELLDKFVVSALNTERRKKKQELVSVDTSLAPVAKDHVHYMIDNGYFGHDQNDRKKQYVIDRVGFYGGKHEFIGENIQYIDLRKVFIKSKGRLTYSKLSKLIIENWKKKPEYYKNMINPKFLGTNQQYALGNGNLFICQVMASRPFIDHYSYLKGDPIIVKAKKECFNCKQVQNKINDGKGHVGWYSVSNDSIYYWNVKYTNIGSHRKNNSRLVFSHKGIIAIDVIHNEQFDCKGNPAFDRSIYNDGYYIGYVDKGMLSNDIHPSPDLYQVYVGQIPAFKDTFYQVDLYYSKKRKPCMNNSIIYVNPDYFKPSEYFNIPKPKIEKNNELIIRDSIEIIVPFERGQTNQDTLIFQPLINSLDSIINLNYTVRTIFYTGIASIEGNQKSNTKLIRKRGVIIQNYLKKYYPNIEFKSLFFENFEDFRNGLGLIGYRKISELSDVEMRDWANKNRDVPEVAELLNSNRQSTVSISFQDELIIDDGVYSLSVQHIKDLIDNGNGYDANTFFQVAAHKAMEGDHVMQDSLLSLSIPFTASFSKLNWYYFVFELNMLNIKITAERLNELFEIGAIENTTQYLEYRLLFNIFNGNSVINVEDFGEVIVSTKRKKTVAWLEVLELISGVQNYRYDSQMVGPMITSSVMKNKFNVHQSYFVCQYLISWGYTVEPYLLLSKYARQKNLFPKLYKQYVKLGYFLQQFDEKREWKRIKIALKILAESNPDEFCDLFKWEQMGVRALKKSEIAKLFCESCKQ